MTPQQIEVMKLALEALGVVTKEMIAIRDELAEYGEGRPITNGIHQLLWDSSFKAYTETAIPAYAALEKALAEHAMREVQRLGQEPVADDIASILACRDMLDAQPVPEVDRVIWPEHAEQEPVFTYEQVKAHIQVAMMSTTTPPQRKPLTDEQILELNFDGEFCVITDDDEQILDFARAIEAAHGVKENQ